MLLSIHPSIHLFFCIYGGCAHWVLTGFRMGLGGSASGGCGLREVRGRTCHAASASASRHGGHWFVRGYYLTERYSQGHLWAQTYVAAKVPRARAATRVGRGRHCTALRGRPEYGWCGMAQYIVLTGYSRGTHGVLMGVSVRL